MTKEEYYRKIESIKMSDAPVEIREEAIEELSKAFCPAIPVVEHGELDDVEANLS